MSKKQSPVDKIDVQLSELQQQRTALLANGLPTTDVDVQIRELSGQKAAIEEEQA